MSRIRADIRLLQLPAARIIKLLHQGRIALITVQSGDIFYLVLFPQPIGSAESTDAGLGRDPCSRQHHDKRLFQLCRRHGIALEYPRAKTLMPYMLTLAKLTQPMASVHELSLFMTFHQIEERCPTNTASIAIACLLDAWQFGYP